MRVPVVEPPREGAIRLERAPLVVGAIEWFDPDPICTAIVKITYEIGEEGLTLAKEQRPLVADAKPEAKEPYDFAPYKPRADVIVVGDAYADPPTPRAEIPVRFSVGALSRAVRVIPTSSAAHVRLGEKNVFSGQSDEPDPIGPRLVEEKDLVRRVFLENYDYTAHQLAPAAQQREDPFAPGEPLRLAGLSSRGELELTLPREIPRVVVVFKRNMPRAELEMVADTLIIDSARAELVVLYRGMVGLPRPGTIDRIYVSLAPARAGRKFAEILRSGARGSFLVSVCPENLDPRPASQEEEDDLTRVRYDLATQAEAPEPTITLEQYAAISAELAEQREPRKDVLERSQLDEDLWMLEERGWLEKMASSAMAGDGTLAARYGELFVAAQDALATPEEEKRTVEDYAAIAVALEHTEDVPRELQDRKIRLSEWMRLDRRMRKAAEADDAVADELERHLEAARRMAGDEP